MFVSSSGLFQRVPPLLRTKRCMGDCSPPSRADGFTHAGTAWGGQDEEDRGRRDKRHKRPRGCRYMCACGYAPAALVDGRLDRGEGPQRAVRWCRTGISRRHRMGMGWARKDVPKHQATVSLLRTGPPMCHLSHRWMAGGGPGGAILSRSGANSGSSAARKGRVGA